MSKSERELVALALVMHTSLVVVNGVVFFVSLVQGRPEILSLAYGIIFAFLGIILLETYEAAGGGR